MTSPGFEAEYSEMKEAAALIEDCKNEVRGPQPFSQQADLSGAIQSAFGGTPSGAPIDMLGNMLYEFIKNTYEPTTKKLEQYLEKTTGQLDALATNLHEAIAEYEQRDHEHAGQIGNIQPPR